MDLVIGRIKSKIEETDVDEFMEDVGDHLKRNPDVLVVARAPRTSKGRARRTAAA